MSAAVDLPFVFCEAEIRILASRGIQDSHEWARRNLRMIDGPLRGHLWNPDITPQAKGIMRAFDDPLVRKLYYLAPSQSGKTTICDACFFSALMHRCDNWGIGMPDEKSAAAIFQARMHKYFTAIAPLRALLKKMPNALQALEIILADDSRISAMWAGSEGSMRSKPMPYVLVDEPDAYADPSALNVMQERAEAYHTMGLSKIIIACRPKGTEEQSVIWADARAQAQAWMQRAARCPACSTLQFMEHERIVPVDGSRDARLIRQQHLGRYECAACKYLWNDNMRNAAVRNGQWVNIKAGAEIGEGRKPDDYGEASIIAFHSRAWESTMTSLSDVLADWFEAQGNPRRLQLFDNNRCAKPYRFVQVEQDWEELRALVADGQEGRVFLDQGVVPDWALTLTIAADMQMDHFFWSVAAHGLWPERLHIVDYGRVADWPDLTSVVFESAYRSEAGVEFRPWRGALDTGGGRRKKTEDSRTQQSYLWLMSQRPGVIFGTRGMSREPSPGIFVDPRNRDKLPDGRKVRRGFHLYFLNTDALKRMIFWSLAEGREEEPISFHARTTDEYLKQIVSERLMQAKNGGEEWQAFRANHYLDCMVGHKAMVNWQWKPNLAQLCGGSRGGVPEGGIGDSEARQGAKSGISGMDAELFTGESLFGGGL